MRMNLLTTPPRTSAIRACRAALVALSLLILAACGDDGTPTALPLDAHIPAPADRSGFEPEILIAFDTASGNVRTSPTSANWSHLGRVYHAHEQLQPAIESYQAAIEAGDATNRTAHLLALALDETGDRQAAVASMRRADTLLPANPTSTWRLGQWLIEEGDQPEAEAAFLRALASAPKDFGSQLAYGKFLLDTGRPKDALEPLARAVILLPNLPYPRFLLGNAMQQAGMENEAEEQLQLGRGSTPTWPDRHAMELAQLVRGPQAELRRLATLSQAGKPGEALPAMLLLGERLKDDPNYHLQVAKTHRRLEQLKEAEASIATTLNLQPNNPEALYQYAGLKRQRWLATPDRNPNNPFLAEALDLADRTIAIRSNDPNAHALRAQILASLGRLDESSAEWLNADRLSDGRQNFEFRSAKVYMDAGQWTRAAERLEEMARKYPNDLPLQRELGLALFKAGQKEYAKAVLLSVNSRMPGDAAVQSALQELP